MQAADEAEKCYDGAGLPMLPLSNKVGFQQLCLRECDGKVLLVSGFNSHVKAACLAGFLERLIHDTV